MPLWPRQRDPLAQLAISSLEYWSRMTGTPPLFTSGAWGVANLAVYIPILIQRPVRVRYVLAEWGATIAGLGAVGFFEDDGSGQPGAQVGGTVFKPQPAFTSFFQSLELDNMIVLDERLWWVGVSMSDATMTVLQVARLTTNRLGPVIGVFTEAAAFPLPAVATPSNEGVAVPIPVLSLMGG